MDDELKALRAMRDAASRGPYVTDGPDVLSLAAGARIARCVLAQEGLLPEVDAEEQDRRNAAWLVAATRWASSALDAHMKPSPCVSTHHSGCACHEARRDAAIAEVTRELREARAEVERLRAIVEGRTTPPTDAEIAAHSKSSGWWLVSSLDDMSLELIEQAQERDWCIEWGAERWLPLDHNGRPCAWPVPATTEGAR
jgi:hypothetical protein